MKRFSLMASGAAGNNQVNVTDSIATLLGKIDALEREHGDLIPLMLSIKASFDPAGILNPGAVFV